MQGTTSTELKIYEDHPSKSLFLKDPKSDFFLIIEDRIIPLHKNVIRECLYFDKIALSQEKVHFINSPLSVTLSLFRSRLLKKCWLAYTAFHCAWQGTVKL